MAYREPIKDQKKDEKIFRRMATNVKAVNITPKTMRGGTRF